MSGGGISVDPGKIEVVVDWVKPKSVQDVQSFLELAKYYRRIVEGFSKLSGTLTWLTRKYVRFGWIEDLVIKPTLLERNKAAQANDKELVEVVEKVQQGLAVDFNISEGGVFRFGTRLCVPNDEVIRRTILEEAHRSLYTVKAEQ
ncbi:uncharacterized protein LOC131162592 [Malania oleifera]|uniref:uncharacterized protein LOC131162592 n=1 Tax=Malania oleifera TaxID=397392 RepID=UPI0025AE79B1|nr:uncharacterized protein LOC131162592 [Malania oleifera]